jgi:hypothetical protein
MVDPMDALVKLQDAVDNGLVVLQAGDIHPDVGVWMDEPAGKTRFTYARVAGRKVEAIALFAHNGSIEGTPCFQIGYAVIESMRQRGIGSELAAKGIAEMRHGFGKHGAKRFYVEAVVGLENIASNMLAKRLLSDAPETIIDAFSGESALRYVKPVDCRT